MSITLDRDSTDRAEPYLTLVEVSRLLGFSHRWVRTQIVRDEFPMRKLGPHGPYRFLWSEVETWMTERSLRTNANRLRDRRGLTAATSQ